MSKKIHLPRTGIIITQNCSLRCKLCCAFAPLYQEPPYIPLEQIKKAIDIYFSFVDSVGDLSVLGGEPLLHKDVYNVIRYIANYSDRVNRILILTNGTIIPSEERLLELCDIPEIKDKLQINISNYGEGLSKKVKDIESLCNKLNIPTRTIAYSGDGLFCDGWVDFGDHSQKYFTEEEIRTHAQKCSFRKNVFSNIDFDGDDIYLSRCARAYWKKHIGVTPKDTNDVIKFPNEITTENTESLKARIDEMLTAEYNDACAFCPGICEDSPRCRPAEQWSPEELKAERQKYAAIINKCKED